MTLETFLVSSIKMKDESRLELEADIDTERRKELRNCKRTTRPDWIDFDRHFVGGVDLGIKQGQTNNLIPGEPVVTWRECSTKESAVKIWVGSLSYG